MAKETYYAIAMGCTSLKKLGDYGSKQEAREVASSTDDIVTETQLIKMRGYIDDMFNTAEDLSETTVIGKPYERIVTLQLVTNKPVAKQLIQFFYTDKWKQMLAKALGVTGIIHFSTDANNVKLSDRGLLLEEKSLLNQAFGDGTCHIGGGSSKQADLPLHKKAKPAKKKAADAVTVAPKRGK